VLLRDMQRHPYKQIIMHLDFQRVDENQAIRVAVPLHFLNEDKSPAGKAADVVVTHELNEVEVSCLPKDLPEFIEIDLSALAVGDIVHLSELKLPKGVEIPELKLGKEHDVAVVIAKHGKEEIEEATDAPAAEVPAAKVAKKDEDKK
jgi:large subunit ribosomal protein L25